MFEQRELWVADATYEKHRIPGMLVTCKGTLLAYNEARRTAEDWAMMDILLQRSTDGGATFSAPVALANGTEQHPTTNNPVMMQDRTGRLHFLYCEDYGTNGGRVLQRTSDDDGITWSAPRDITRFTAPAERTCFALGPGHGICTDSGMLLVPVWLVPALYGTPTRKHGPSVVTTLTSTDNGESWASCCGQRARSSAPTKRQPPSSPTAAFISTSARRRDIAPRRSAKTAAPTGRATPLSVSCAMRDALGRLQAFAQKTAHVPSCLQIVPILKGAIT